MLHSPEFVQRPVVSGAVLGVLDLDRHDGLGHGRVVVLVVVDGGTQVGGKGRVKSVSEESELELHLRKKKRRISGFPGHGTPSTFFLSSTEMAFASFRKIALPHKSSRSDVNWWCFHFLHALAANSYSFSVQLHSASNRGFTAKAPRLNFKASKKRALDRN